MASSIILGGPTLLQAYGAKGLSTPIVNLDVFSMHITVHCEPNFRIFQVKKKS